MDTRTRYLLFQLPGWIAAAIALLLLRRWLELAWTTLALLWLAWVAKDLLMYRLVKPAYVVDERTEIEKLVGATGVVCRPLDPVGYLRFRSELWRAEAATAEELPIAPGERVRVQQTRGLTLIVGRLREQG